MNTKCEGCNKVTTNTAGEKLCLVFPSPDAKWRFGNCPMASHLVVVVKKDKKLNPIKASKRGV